MREVEVGVQLVHELAVQLQRRVAPRHQRAAGIVGRVQEIEEELGARVAVRRVRRLAGVHGHIAAVGGGEGMPRRSALALVRRAGVLIAADEPLRHRVVGDVVHLADLQIAVQREPVAGVVLGRSAPVHAAVVHLDDVAVRVEDHLARVRVRRAGVCGAAAGHVRHVRPVRQVFPLRRRRFAGGRDAGVAAEQPAAVIARADRAGHAKAAVLQLEEVQILPVAADVHRVAVVGVHQNGEVDAALGARFEARIQAVHGVVQLPRQRQVHGRPNAALIVREADVVRLSANQHGDEHPAVRANGQLGVVVVAESAGAGHPAGESAGEEGIVARRVPPSGAAVVAAKHALTPDGRVHPVGVAGIHHQIERRRGWRDAVDRRPGGAAIGGAEHAAALQAGFHRRRHDAVAARGDTGDVVEHAEHRVANLAPGFAGVAAAQQAGAVAAGAPVAAVAANAGDDGVAILGIEHHCADGKRTDVIRERAPSRAQRGGVVGAPDAAVGRADVEDVRVRRMRQHGVRGAHHLVVRCHAFDLAEEDGPGPLRCPTAAESGHAGLAVAAGDGRRGGFAPEPCGRVAGRSRGPFLALLEHPRRRFRRRWRAPGLPFVHWEPSPMHLGDRVVAAAGRPNDIGRLRRQHGAGDRVAADGEGETPAGHSRQRAAQGVSGRQRKGAFDDGIERRVAEQIEAQRPGGLECHALRRVGFLRREAARVQRDQALPQAGRANRQRRSGHFRCAARHGLGGAEQRFLRATRRRA